MAAGTPVIRGFDPTNREHVAELRAPQDNVNNPDATQTIHPADKLFGHNGTIIRGNVHGRQQQKNHGSLRKFEDIQGQVRTMVRDIRKAHSEGVSYLKGQRKEELELDPEADVSEIDKKIAERQKKPVVAFQIICTAPFKNSRDALSGKHAPITVNTFAHLREFATKVEVEKLNKQIEEDGGIMCRPYDGAKTDDDRIYYPKWHLI